MKIYYCPNFEGWQFTGEEIWLRKIHEANITDYITGHRPGLKTSIELNYPLACDFSMKPVTFFHHQKQSPKQIPCGYYWLFPWSSTIKSQSKPCCQVQEPATNGQHGILLKSGWLSKTRGPTVTSRRQVKASFSLIPKVSPSHFKISQFDIWGFSYKRWVATVEAGKPLSLKAE